MRPQIPPLWGAPERIDEKGDVSWPLRSERSRGAGLRSLFDDVTGERSEPVKGGVGRAASGAGPFFGS